MDARDRLARHLPHIHPGRGPTHLAGLPLRLGIDAEAARIGRPAGICFLWFIGVVRDGLGRFEDKFFASVFLGSGLLFLAMIFVSSAVGVALVASRGADYGADVHVFGQALLIALSKTYALRMAAVFMMSLATIWLKTGLVSRGLVIFTYVVALTLLVASDVTVWLTLAFPVWVLIVSVLALSKAGLIDLHRDGD